MEKLIIRANNDVEIRNKNDQIMVIFPISHFSYSVWNSQTDRDGSWESFISINFPPFFYCLQLICAGAGKRRPDKRWMT